MMNQWILGSSATPSALKPVRLAFHCLKQYLCGLVSGGVRGQETGRNGKKREETGNGKDR